MRKFDLSKDLKEVRELATHFSGRQIFRVESTTRATVPKLEYPWCVYEARVTRTVSREERS